MNNHTSTSCSQITKKTFKICKQTFGRTPKDGTLAKLAEKFLGNKDYIPTKDALKVPSKNKKGAGNDSQLFHIIKI